MKKVLQIALLKKLLLALTAMLHLISPKLGGDVSVTPAESAINSAESDSLRNTGKYTHTDWTAYPDGDYSVDTTEDSKGIQGYTITRRYLTTVTTATSTYQKYEYETSTK